ncbi:MAG: hypothetical protein J4O01_11080 [Chloroflexi bacterium]|nr:hypothetical protein [Chloroflexota bacterium]
MNSMGAMLNWLILEYCPDSVDPIDGKVYFDNITVDDSDVYSRENLSEGIELKREAAKEYRVA